MSLFKSITSGIKKIISSPLVRAVAPVIGGPIGMTIAAAGTARAAYTSMKPGPSIGSMPGVGNIGHQGMSMFPGLSLGGAIGTVGRVGGALAGVGVAGATRVMKSATAYCRKHPAWCQTIGGVAAIEAMIQRGELPMMKHRRGRGISATELKHFKRVARFTSKYCAPVRKAMKSPAMRRSKSCQ